MLLASDGFNYDLGTLLGGQLSTLQIYHAAGALFFALFALSALRHGKRAGGWYPAVWGTMALGLLTVALYIAGRGFPEYIPDFFLPYATVDSLARGAAVGSLLVWAVVFLSAHWVNGSLAQWWHRLAGLAFVGLALWLTTGWFGSEIPDEAKPWTASTILIRLGALAGLIFLALAFWTRGTWASDHHRWFNRAPAPLALAATGLLTMMWFGFPANPFLSQHDVQQLLILIGTIATATCLLIAVGAWFMRSRRPPAPIASNNSAPAPKATKPISKPLPIAVLLDANGRPISPPS